MILVTSHLLDANDLESFFRSRVDELRALDVDGGDSDDGGGQQSKERCEGANLQGMETRLISRWRRVGLTTEYNQITYESHAGSW